MEDHRLSLYHLARFLVGRTTSIRALAGNRSTLSLGLLFCLSTALARHYDAKYLIREPWFLLAPAAASILTSAILFGAMYLSSAIQARQRFPRAWDSYLTILGLYWMTAPMAWLYGIPFERFLGERDAASANVWILSIVSIWRVLILSRVYAVLFGTYWIGALIRLGTFAFTLVYAGLFVARVPLVNFMGGVHLPPSVEPVADLVLGIEIYGFFGLIFGWLFIIGRAFARKPDLSMDAFAVSFRSAPEGPVVGLALAALVMFVVPLPWTQAEQRLRYESERLYKSGRIPEFVASLAAHPRTAFPPQWSPPPWPEYPDAGRDLKILEIVAVVESRPDLPAWIRAAYRDKAEGYVTNHGYALGDAKERLAAFAGLRIQP